MKLTVYWENGFWYGLIEDERDGRIVAYRHTFGSEPHDAEVLTFVHDRMMPAIGSVMSGINRTGMKPAARVSPKRLQRQVVKQLQQHPAFSQAQEAWKLELAHRKREKHSLAKEEREALRSRKRMLAEAKAKAKHRGR
ncbi:YjdF family protein [Paenibacillus aurantiacus]|uniref:YjdF family protein n=1 Tax=Paenibacillus aurantiacus TaxID=1936118 RepID=A0ABV5L1M4_9BACL